MKKNILLVSFYDLDNENLNGVTKIGFNLTKYAKSNIETLIVPYSQPGKLITLFKYILKGNGVFNDYMYREQLIKNVSLIESESKKYDVVHFLGPQFLYLDTLLSEELLKKTVVQPIDNLLIFKGRLTKKVSLLKKVFYGLEIYKLKSLYEDIISYEKIIFVSKRDSRLFNKISKLSSVPIENGVDLGFGKKTDFEIKNRNEVKLVFHGDLTYGPNVEATYFLNELGKKLGKCFKIDVVGKYNAQLESECSSLNFLGFVDDLSDSLTKYDMYICPIFSGSGIKNKFLEAGYMKIPMISTGEAAVGTSLKASIDYEHAESMDDFLSSILRLSNDKNLRKSLSENASRKIEKSFSWNQVVERYEAEYNKVYCNNNPSVG
ncbi:glycosyltransferase family 4 protein [Vibrio parahaemolyticus]|uniref:RfaB n=1 Tax=Vibrio parahaemolyticus TaxID=670 RepID=A0A5P5X5Z0_VIBPH|nr:glycosyltransferase family 4 protein [Vibrio parahaemolyticus]QFF90527.1 RfaB [Vibrio parahaemolyticus]